MNHPYELLADLMDGTLDEGDLAGVQAHLDSCASCREDVADAKRRRPGGSIPARRGPSRGSASARRRRRRRPRRPVVVPVGGRGRGRRRGRGDRDRAPERRGRIEEEAGGVAADTASAPEFRLRPVTSW